MPTGTYTIDATNNAEPLDSRYVADFPAELRAMKTRMNSAISSIGSLTGALMSDGTNNMTGKLGVGTVADAGTMLHVLGASKLVGTVNVTGKVDVTGSGFSPGSSSVISAATVLRGAYGGGMVMIDGAAYSGAWITGSTMVFGLGSSTGLTTKFVIGASASTFYGESACSVAAVAGSGYAAFSLNSSGTNNSYVFFTNGSGERARITADNGNNLYFSHGISAVVSLTLDSTRSATISGDEINIGSYNAGEKRMRLSNQYGSVYNYLSTAGNFGIFDPVAAVLRWNTDVAGNFTAAGNVTAYSDARLKHDVQKFGNALDTVERLRGVRFKWNRDGSSGVGFIAQEVEEVLPELVLHGEHMSVAYGNMTAVLVEAVKELRAEVRALRAELTQSKGV